MKRLTGILSVLFILALLASAFVGPAAAKQNDSEQNYVDERTDLTPEERADVIEELRSHEKILGIYGSLPDFSDTKTSHPWISWYSQLDHFTDDNFDSFAKPRLYPKGPVIGYGYDVEGYIDVGIPEDWPEDNITATMEELYEILDKKGKDAGFESIPVKFRSVSVRPDSLVLYSASNKSRPITGDIQIQTILDRIRPLIGGMQIQTLLGSDIASSTLGWAAQTSSGTRGYVISAHCSDGSGETVYQPTTGSSNACGSVGADPGWPYSSSYADAAWVPYSNVAAKIHSQGVDQSVKGHYDPWPGLTVFKSGRTTGTTSGSVQRKDIVFYPSTQRYLYDQYFASYTAEPGDSGSPVYHVESDHDRIIVGILSGSFCGEEYFSPVSGVETELGVLPLTS
ncbi:S1 family peptidase [Methanofollis ethanolicus]|uniref:S1 family peptidase n=1 Tax=Methanofollis ethanolicus TaxID=488124 RepID=UPI000A83423F|nr:S1 family peptidase [Methanofollis ethanolicus]